ncbi:hypothetical protein [Streptomyces sp. NPDC057740]|uniref:hypothetical protein n=1 Tax=Streptomyces sp. NPDC057740 TaxID=3346234 RepID=UPI00368298A3
MIEVIERAGHEEHFDEEQGKRPVLRHGHVCQGRWGYRSRVEAREEKSPRTMPRTMPRVMTSLSDR